MVNKIDGTNFDEKVMKVQGLAVVDMYADWCGPCKMMAPVVENMSQDYPDVSFFKLNVDESPDIAGRYNVMSIPTFLFIRNGTVVKTLVGGRDQESFESEIDALK